MNILSIGYTKDLLDDKDASDTKERMSYYSTYLSNYYVIVHTLKKDGFQQRMIGNNFEVIPSNGWNSLHSFLRILKIGVGICKNRQIHVIQAQDPIFTGLAAYFIARWFRIPLNVTVYGTNPYDSGWLSESLKNRLVAFISRYILGKVDAIQVDGTKTQTILSNHLRNSKRIYLKPLIPPDSALFYNACGESVRKEILQLQFKKIVLFVGRLEKQKNLYLYLDAVYEIIEDGFANVLFLIIGDGSEREGLRRKTRQLNIEANLRWIPYVKRSLLPSYYAACDVLVLPSLYEGFARVLMEAAMAGRPIVTTDVSGADDIIVNGESGFIVPINNKDELKKKVLVLLNDEYLAKRMGEEARNMMRKKYDYEILLRKQIEIWSELAGNPS
jgi:glycosyltransferase involved in cell wall biosynthesis